MEYFWILEYIGIFAFAVNGAFVGIEYKFDYFGIPFLAITTSLGGGMIRDALLGNTPPMSFRNPVNICIAVGVAALCITFYLIFRKKLNKRSLPAIVTAINIFDAVGLAAFTVSGAQIAYTLIPEMSRMAESNVAAQLILVVFIAVISSVGGGIMRDVFANRKPLVLRRDLYATISVLGAVAFFVLSTYTPLDSLWITLICVFLILAVRLIAMRRKINLPHFKDTQALKKANDAFDKRAIPFEGESDDADDNLYF